MLWSGWMGPDIIYGPLLTVTPKLYGRCRWSWAQWASGHPEMKDRLQTPGHCLLQGEREERKEVVERRAGGKEGESSYHLAMPGSGSKTPGMGVPEEAQAKKVGS